MRNNTDRMRVVHITHSLDPAAGGPPAVVRGLSAALSRRAAVTVAAVIRAEEAVALPPVSVLAAVAGRPPAALAELVEAADVIHLHGVWEPVLLAAATAASRAGVPYLVAPHGMLDPWSLSQRRWKKRLALAAGFRRMLDRAAAIHALNRDEGALLAPLGLRTPTRVVPNGVELEQIDPVGGSPPAGRYVLFLGRLHPKKGLDVLAEAFARAAGRHPGVRLVVAGPDGGAETDFARKVAAAGIADRVSVVGPVYGPDKWGLLRGAAAFCLPSRQEGFSMAILEAMACRVPVVVSENCHFPEVAEAGAGAVVPLAAEAVAAGLDRVLTNSDAARRMGEAGRRLVEERYTWDKVAERCERVYLEILGRS